MIIVKTWSKRDIYNLFYTKLRKMPFHTVWSVFYHCEITTFTRSLYAPGLIGIRERPKITGPCPGQKVFWDVKKVLALSIFFSKKVVALSFFSQKKFLPYQLFFSKKSLFSVKVTMINWKWCIIFFKKVFALSFFFST